MAGGGGGGGGRWRFLGRRLLLLLRALRGERAEKTFGIRLFLFSMWVCDLFLFFDSAGGMFAGCWGCSLCLATLAPFSVSPCFFSLLTTEQGHLLWEQCAGRHFPIYVTFVTQTTAVGRQEETQKVSFQHKNVTKRGVVIVKMVSVTTNL